MFFRDRPFNRGGGGYVFFSLRNVFRTTQELEHSICRAKREIFFQILTLGYMTKILNQIIFFLHQNQNIFFSNSGNQNIFIRKKKHTNFLQILFRINFASCPAFLRILLRSSNFNQYFIIKVSSLKHNICTIKNIKSTYM